jgi:hypothetical protein
LQANLMGVEAAFADKEVKKQLGKQFQKAYAKYISPQPSALPPQD